MLDISLNSQHSTRVEFNAVSGTLIKSCDESKIIRFHMNSERAKMFFDINNPHSKLENDYPYEKVKIVVLQVMLCGGDQYLVEYLEKKENKE